MTQYYNYNYHTMIFEKNNSAYHIFFWLILGVVGPSPLQLSLSFANCSPSLIPRSLMSSLTRSIQRCLFRPLGRILSGFYAVISCTVWPSALHAGPAQLIRLLLRIPTMFGSLNISLSSALVLRSYIFPSFGSIDSPLGFSFQKYYFFARFY